MGGPSSWEWMIYFGLPALLQAVVVFVGVYLGVRYGLKKILSKADFSEPGPQDAMEVVRGRYARGEIPRAEYEQLRDDLETEDPRSGGLQARERRTR
ncbi:MAG: hypothetical protein WA990_04620 [Rubrobacteraceae bacterium]